MSQSVSALRPSPPPNSTTDADIDLLVAVLAGGLSSPAGRATAAGLVDAFGGLAGIAAADVAALRREGLSEAGITILTRVRALAVAMARAEACRRPVLSSWNALTSYLRAALAHAPREQFRALYLDKRNILIREEWRADGTVDHAPVYVATVIDCYLALTAGRSVMNSRQCRVEGGRP